MVSKEKRQLYNQRYYAKKKMESLKIILPEIIEERNDNTCEMIIPPPPNPFDFLFFIIMKAYNFIKNKLFFKY